LPRGIRKQRVRCAPHLPSCTAVPRAFAALPHATFAHGAGKWRGARDKALCGRGCAHCRLYAASVLYAQANNGRAYSLRLLFDTHTCAWYAHYFCRCGIFISLRIIAAIASRTPHYWCRVEGGMFRLGGAWNLARQSRIPSGHDYYCLLWHSFAERRCCCYALQRSCTRRRGGMPRAIGNTFHRRWGRRTWRWDCWPCHRGPLHFRYRRAVHALPLNATLHTCAKHPLPHPVTPRTHQRAAHTMLVKQPRAWRVCCAGVSSPVNGSTS